MRSSPCAIVLVLALTAGASAQAPPDEKKAIGTQMPDVEFVADDDSTFRLSAL